MCATLSLLTCDESGNAYVHDPDTGEILRRIKHRGQTRGTAQISQNEAVSVSSYGCWRDIVIWDVESGEVIRKLKPEAESQMNSVLCLPNFRRIVIGGDNGEIYLYDAYTFTEDPRELSTMVKLKEHRSFVYGMEHPSEILPEQLFTVSYDKTCKIWDLNRQQVIASLEDHTVWFRFGLALDQVHGIVYTGAGDKMVRSWDIRTHQKIAEITAPDYVTSLIYRPAYDQVVVQCYRGQMQLVDARNASMDTVLKQWLPDTGGKSISNYYGGCDVPDRDMFVTTCMSNDYATRAWKGPNAEAVWGVRSGEEKNFWSVSRFVDDFPDVYD